MSDDYEERIARLDRSIAMANGYIASVPAALVAAMTVMVVSELTGSGIIGFVAAITSFVVVVLVVAKLLVWNSMS